MKYYRPSIFVRLFASFMTLTLILLIAAVMVYYHYAVSLTDLRLRNELDALKNNHAVNFIDNYINPLTNTLSLLSITPAIQKLNITSATEKNLLRFEIERQLYQIYKQSNSKYLSIRYIDPLGMEQVKISEGKRNRNYYQLQEGQVNPYVTTLFNDMFKKPVGSIEFSSAFRGPSGNVEFYAGISVREPDLGGFGGVIIIKVNLAEYERQTFNLDVKSSRHARLVLPDEKNADIDLIETITLYSDKDKTRPILQVEFPLPDTVIDQQLNVIFFTALIILLFASILAMFVSMYLSRSISRPINSLILASQEMANGRFEPINTLSRFDEVNQLSASFNAMAAALKSLLDELKQREHILESTVSERTTELRKVNVMFRQVIDTIPMRVFWKDRDLNYLGCNVNFAHDAGLDNPEQIIGKSDFEMGWKNQAEQYRADDRHIIESGISKLGYEEPQTTPEGNTIWLQTSKMPLSNSSGEIIGVLGMYEDITARKEVEIELNEARIDAQRANKAKSEFLANMSHEIRTPMNGVIGMTYLALQTELNETQRNYIMMAHESAHNLLAIINDILDFSKIESGKIELELTNFQLANVLSQINALLELRASERSIKLEYTIDEKIPDYLYGDPLRLEQVLVNLVANAIKFSNDNSSIEIDISVLDLKGSHITLQVAITDHGIGISDEQQKNLFTAFSQADVSTTRKFGGTGLGLTISKRLVNLMGGEIGVNSAEGIGSTFYFTLPLTLVDQQNLSNQSTSPEKDAEQVYFEKLKGKKVLLVDDNEINRELAQALLEMADMQIITASNGQEALDAVISDDLDLVLMDCQMPIMDGYDATRHIRDLGKAGQLPIIAMTANAMKGDREKALAAGMDDYLSKPLEPELMFEVMANWLDKSSGHE